MGTCPFMVTLRHDEFSGLASASSFEELYQHRSEGPGGYVVRLTFHSVVLGMRKDIRKRSGGVAHPHRARATVHHEGRDRNRSPLVGP